MTDFMQQISLVIPAVSIVFVIFITSINLYIKIRRKFSISVNCWFCNRNTKVPYVQWNSWHCPSCEQYNGFNEDGDYNCDIPAQRQVKLNKLLSTSSSSAKGSIVNGSIISDQLKPNGLCDPCNRNQELKVQQLASFCPDNENDFDDEVEEFSRKLELSYRLCPRCERHLKRTLTRVKRNVLGSKLAQIGSNGLRALDIHIATLKIRTQKRRQAIITGCLITMCLLSTIGLAKVYQNAVITKAKLETMFSPFIVSAILMGMSYITVIKILTFNFGKYILSLAYISRGLDFVKHSLSYIYATITGTLMDTVMADILSVIGLAEPFGPQLEPIFQHSSDISTILNLAGCMLSALIVFICGSKTGPSLNLLLWSLSMALPSIFQESAGLHIELIIDITKISIMLLSLGTSMWNAISKISTEPMADSANSSFHRLQSDMNSDVSDESDVETEINMSQQSVFSNRSVRSKKSSKLMHNSLNNSNNSISPSAFSNFSSNGFTTSSTMSLNHLPQHELNRTYTKSNHGLWEVPHSSGMAENTFNSQQSCASGYTSVSRSQHEQRYRRSFPNDTSQNGFMASTGLGDVTSPHIDTSFHSRCSSRNSCYDIPEDFQSGITQLSIGSTRKQLQYVKKVNPSLFDLTMRDVPSSFELRQRQRLVQPSKLNFTDNRTRLPGHQTSWVAGGYWNQSISPQKRHVFNVEQPAFGPRSKIIPMVSRTSSQSSGFESQNGSLKNGHENHSNDSSISDEIDRTSIYSETPYVPNQSNRNHNWQYLKAPEIARSMSNMEMPVSEEISQPLLSTLSDSIHPLVQHQLSRNDGNGSHIVLNHMPRERHAYRESPVSFISQPVLNSSNRFFNGPQSTGLKSFNFNKIDKPAFKKGSLLRLHNQNAGGSSFSPYIGEDAQTHANNRMA